jgi:DNA mismatch endonuclease (patch repair protein)
MMTDVLTKAQRSYNMSRIRAKDTSPEKKLRKLLYQHGIRGYRIHWDLPGKPDIVFVKRRIAVFIDGCFWHRCPVHYTQPETRKEFWRKKIESNLARDRKTDTYLRKEGWTIIRIWEHEIKEDPEKAVQRIISCLS